MIIAICLNQGPTAILTLGAEGLSESPWLWVRGQEMKCPTVRIYDSQKRASGSSSTTMVLQPTEDHNNKAHSEYSPWPGVTSIMRDLHTDPIFFQDLLCKIQEFDKVLNLDGLRSQLSELLEYPDDCTATRRGGGVFEDGEVHPRPGSNRSLNAMTELGNWFATLTNCI